MTIGEGLSKKPILIKDIATSTLPISREEQYGFCCTITAFKAHACLCISPRAHGIHCTWHKGRIKKGEHSREVARRVKEVFSGPSALVLPVPHTGTHKYAYLSLGRRRELTAISHRMVAVTQQDMDGQINTRDDVQQTKRWPSSSSD